MPEVRRAAQQALASLGWSWQGVADGGLDAAWTSRFLRYKDDIFIRLHSANGTLVRVRSVSRTGTFDFGQNARHIREFFDELEQQLAPAIAVKRRA